MESGDIGQILVPVSPTVAAADFKPGLAFAITLNQITLDLLVRGQMSKPLFAQECDALI